MKRPLIYFFFLFLLFVAACDKGVCVEGTVTDIKTGQPISGVKLRLGYYYFDHGSRIPKDETVFTNDSGEFSYSADEKHSEDIGVWEVAKTGYPGVFESEHEQRDCEDVRIKMVPYDGLLKLKIINETGTHNLAYVQVRSNCSGRYGYDPYNSTVPSPLELLPGTSRDQTFYGCIGDLARIRWKFAKNDSWIEVGSVLITDSDTTFYQIKY